jgi:ketol-acid reductoisomerase
MMEKYYDADADIGVLKGKRIAVIGYGSQGRGQSLNLKDSGLDVVIGLRKGKSWDAAIKDGESDDGCRSCQKGRYHPDPSSR